MSMQVTFVTLSILRRIYPLTQNDTAAEPLLLWLRWIVLKGWLWALEQTCTRLGQDFLTHPLMLMYEFAVCTFLQVMRGRAVESARVDENVDVLCVLQDGLVTLDHPRPFPLLFSLSTQPSD